MGKPFLKKNFLIFIFIDEVYNDSNQRNKH
jgi:hypothetical protein